MQSRLLLKHFARVEPQLKIAFILLQLLFSERSYLHNQLSWQLLFPLLCSNDVSANAGNVANEVLNRKCLSAWFTERATVLSPRILSTSQIQVLTIHPHLYHEDYHEVFLCHFLIFSSEGG